MEEDAIQKRKGIYRLFYQIIDDFIEDRIALNDVKEEKDVLIKGDEELPVQFKRLIYLYDELETVPKFDPPVTPVNAKDYVLKVAKIFDDAHGQHGWIHIRQSVHNPNIALNMQSSVIGGCQSIAKVLLNSFLLPSGVKEYADISFQVE